MPEDLVASAGHRVARRRGEAEQDVAHRVGGARNGGRSSVEAAGSVVEQGWVAREGHQAEGRVALVTGRPDRVVALALLLQPARREVQVPTLHLGVEEA